MGRKPTSDEALQMRAARAAEDPKFMIHKATLIRFGRYIAEALKANPDLEPLEAARAGWLLMRADMVKITERRQAARKARDEEAEAPPGDAA